MRTRPLATPVSAESLPAACGFRYSWENLNDTLGDQCTVGAEDRLHKTVKASRAEDVHFHEGEAGEQFLGGGSIAWIIGARQQRTVYVIRLEFVGNETAVDDDPLDAGAASQID